MPDALTRPFTDATAGTSTTFVGETIGRAQLALLSRSWRSFASARERYDAVQFLDVDHQAFVADHGLAEDEVRASF